MDIVVRVWKKVVVMVMVFGGVRKVPRWWTSLLCELAGLHLFINDLSFSKHMHLSISIRHHLNFCDHCCNGIVYLVHCP